MSNKDTETIVNFTGKRRKITKRTTHFRSKQNKIFIINIKEKGKNSNKLNCKLCGLGSIYSLRRLVLLPIRYERENRY